MQSFTCSGRLTKEPTLSYKGDVALCTFILAVESRKYKRTDFFPVAVWRDLGVACANYLVKGQKIVILGEWRSSNYQENGKNMTKFEIWADQVEYGEQPKKSN
ncbi:MULTISPECIES: single-stranded DNA-binding protein [Bacillus]|uniref:single-stranded DNA-binding protein n=1 Tax=Bacillus TaxID=1386 RepID=UPI000C776699|nr:MULTISPECIES: single-stranded DNA-binding protein [Bacillus]MCP1161399.1 single-stranded DNA-binding protein [Bacillus infantis]PLR70494.1 single-strand DNA-binding protein [Bacillus sp. UMB0728]